MDHLLSDHVNTFFYPPAEGAAAHVSMDRVSALFRGRSLWQQKVYCLNREDRASSIKTAAVGDKEREALLEWGRTGED
ncbi:hypothetical protein OJAV_G00237100 [Oryzias javanicus]|uniref:Uncharacterized protein n=1 Tax=Oryzias javanicus TaxID=123683 RepID=A0A437BY33_ORYJA|nr:hypothetical protein OJAV_G00237100 [Oryzias javanicus]